MTQQPPGDLPPPFQLSRMITGLWVPRAIHVAADLGIADVLADGPKSSAEIAAAVGAHADALHRLLRGLAVIGLCGEREDGTFELTPLGACLRSGTRDSVRSWALLMGGPGVWGAWARLGDCVRTGRSAPDLDGKGTFDDIEATPEVSRIFDQSMVELTRHLAGAIAMSYDFSPFRTLADVGGGYGALLPPILAANPHLRGMVVDLPRCREGAERLFEKTGVAERCEFVAADVFRSVPAGADAYLLKSVIHDWDDEKSIAILRNCRAAMGQKARLLLVEVIVPERVGASPLDGMIAATDLNMLVNTGGKERTEREYRALLEAAGLRVTNVVATPAAFSIVEVCS